jgi:hypothetical protein
MTPDQAALLARVAVEVFEDEHPITAAMRQRLRERIQHAVLAAVADGPRWCPEAPTHVDPRSL